MEQKIKFIIIGLIAVLTVSLIFNVATFSAKQAVARERDKLKEENASLAKKVEDSLKENKSLQEKINLLNQNIDRLSKEKEEVFKKLELLEKTRQELVKQVKALKEQGQEQTVPSGMSQTQDAYWAGILKSKKDLELQLDNLRNELKTAQINNEQLDKQKSSLELEVNNLSREKEEFMRQADYVKKQLEYNKKIMDTTTLELVAEKNDKMQIEETLKTIKNENAILRRQLKNLNDRKISLEKKLAEAQAENTTLENRFTEMDILLKDKMLQVDRLSKQIATGQNEQEGPVELSPIVVRPQSEVTKASEAPRQGRVLAVNRENNFVVIDLGDEGGASRVGDVFHVYNKEGKLIATIEVIETRRAISACDIRKETAPIKIGDVVK
jgi:hypothetical protein